MIKINLATRKQSAGVSAGGDGKTGWRGGGLTKANISMDQLRDVPVRKYIAPVAIAILASFGLDMYKEEELGKADAILAQLAEEKTRLQTEADKMKNYEEIKKAIEADEVILRTKIDTIAKLLSDRTNPPKVLLALANATPKDVWLSEFKITERDVEFKGYSMGFNPISDFMKNLGESAYFSDLNIKNTQQVKDDRGQDVAAFELTARRR